MNDHRDRPTWDEYWSKIGNEQWLAAKALLELSRQARNDVESWLRWNEEELYDTDGNVTGVERVAALDWDEWADDFEKQGRGYSDTECHLLELVAALTAQRPLRMTAVLSYTGSWETDVWRILTEWGTGGNNRDRPGRATVTTRR